jgi:hypothetical protein
VPREVLGRCLAEIAGSVAVRSAEAEAAIHDKAPEDESLQCRPQRWVSSDMSNQAPPTCSIMVTDRSPKLRGAHFLVAGFASPTPLCGHLIATAARRAASDAVVPPFSATARR